MKAHKLFLSFAALFGLLAVIIGAVKSHGAKLTSFCPRCDNLSETSLQQLDTAITYQFYHIVGLLAVGILISFHRNYGSFLLKVSGLAFLLGIILFSGGLYAFIITEDPLYSKVTPYGGVSFILGWFFLFIYALKN